VQLFKSKKALLIIAAIIVLFAAGIFSYLKFFNHAKSTGNNQSNNTDNLVNLSVENSTEVVPTNMDNTVMSSFSDIRAVAEKDGAKWVATQGIISLKDNKVNWYNQKDGLPGSFATDIINHNGQIWAGMSGGVAKYDDKNNKFISYLSGETNIKLFSDTYSNTLYASTFRGFYHYNSATDTWVKEASVNTPIDSQQVVFTQNTILGTSQQAHPVVIYDKNNKTWIKPTIPEYGNQQVLNLFKVGDRVILYGRAARYSGCSEQNKEPASFFMEYKDNSWESIKSLNDKFFNYEPNVVEIIENKAIFAYMGETCESTPNAKQITADFSASTIVLGEETDYSIEQSSMLGRKSFAAIGKELADATKLSPSRIIKAIDDEGNILAKTSNVITNGVSGFGGNGFSVLRPTTLGYIEQSILPNNKDNPNHIDPIMGKDDGKMELKYVLARDIDEMGGELVSASLYSIDNRFKATLMENIGKDVIAKISGESSEWIYKNDSLYFLDNIGKGYKLNLKTSAIVEIPSKSKTYGQGRTIVNGSDIWFYSPKNKELFKFDTEQEVLTLVNVSKISSNLTTESALIAVDSKSLWFTATSESSNAAKKVYAIDYDSNQLGSFQITNEISTLTLINESYAIGKKRNGVFIVNRSNYEVSMFENSKMPFWGYGENNTTDFSAFDRLDFNFISDKKYGKIWFFQDGTSFSLDENQIK
jgi:hypothetical protein